MNPILDFGIDRDAIQYIGEDLQRPECILAERDGTLWSADARGVVVKILRGGSQQVVMQAASEDFSGAPSEAARYLQGTLPNGLAFARNGDILISNFGTDRLEIMTRDGATRVGRRLRWQAHRQSQLRASRFADGYLARYKNGRVERG